MSATLIADIFLLSKKEVTKCKRTGCTGKQKFEKMSFRNYKEEIESFYCLNRKSLDEYWKCVLAENWLICLEWCKSCGCCKELKAIHTELKEAYFFSLRTDVNYQQTMWKFFLKNGNTNEDFRVEIGAAEESDKMIE